MNLVFVGENTKSDITCLASHQDFTFASTDSKINIFKRAKFESVLKTKKSDYSIFQMLVIGDVLIAACTDNILRIWNHATRVYLNEIKLPKTFEMSFFMHPATYMNKIIIGGQNGKIQLWNMNTIRLIHEFDTGFTSPITCIAQSPVVDVVAFGLLDGRIILRNLKTDQTIITFTQDSKVTCITFRTGNSLFFISIDFR